MENRYAAIVRIGDRTARDQHAVDEISRVHIAEGVWSSDTDRNLPAGMPIIASHVNAGRGQFLLGVATGTRVDIPWEPLPEHANHVGHGVTFMNAVFTGAIDAVLGTTVRTIHWLTREEFAAALAEMTPSKRFELE